jgi:hypothetical protein
LVAARIINKGISRSHVARDGFAGQSPHFQPYSGAPAGSGINPTTCVFTWGPGNDIQPAPTTSRCCSDNAAPPRIATQILTLIVRNRSADFTVSRLTNVFGGESNAVPRRLSNRVEPRGPRRC